MGALTDPVNALCDEACNLLDASRQLREALGRPGTEPAFAATLGCMQAMLDELEHAHRMLRDQLTASAHERGRDPDPAAAALREVVGALHIAQRSCEVARRRASRLGRA